MTVRVPFHTGPALIIVKEVCHTAELFCGIVYPWIFVSLLLLMNLNLKILNLNLKSNLTDTLLPTQMFPRLPARATFVADTNFVSGTQKMFPILFRNILCPQQMFPSLRSPRNIMSNNVSATMCPRLPVPLFLPNHFQH